MPEHTFDEKRTARLDNPERRKLLPHDHILPLLDVHKHDLVLDVGAGAGYFTFPLAKQTTNTVYALDMERAMLDYIKKKSDEHGRKNIQLMQERLENTPLQTGSVQRILASMVLHEVTPLDQALEEIYRVLAPGGRFVLIDWVPEPRDQRPNRIHANDMRKVAEHVGFSLRKQSTPSEAVYALTFEKPGK